MRNFTLAAVLSACFYLPIGIVADYCTELIQANRRHAHLNKQVVTYGHIKKTGIVPRDLNDISNLPGVSSYVKDGLKYIDYYNSDVWGEPQRIFFMHRDGGLYYVTYGDGSHAIVKYWHKPYQYIIGGEDIQKWDIPYLSGKIAWFNHWLRMLIFGSIAIGATMLVYGTLGKRLSEKRHAHNAG